MTRTSWRDALSGYNLLKEALTSVNFVLWFSFKTKLFVPNDTLAPFHPKENQIGTT